MTPGQHDAAMIHLRRWPAGLVENQHRLALDQCSAARGAPVGNGLRAQHGVAVAAYAFHAF